MKTNCHRAFTLLELLVALAILATLTSAVVGAGRFAAEASRKARAKGELALIASGLAAYRSSCGQFPITDDPALLLQALVGRRSPQLQPLDVRPFLETQRLLISHGADPLLVPSAVLLDPWERPYRYQFAAPGAAWRNPGFVLYSTGPDGVGLLGAADAGFPDHTRAENRDNLYAETTP
jgi:prepilin-type N-terminal cleavage/methylation domain-containing protein